MKFLALLFLVGIALAVAAPAPVPIQNAVSYSNLEDLNDDLANEAADEDPKTELGKKLKENFDEILEKLKEALENGKGIKEDTLEKLKDIREKLKELKIDLSKHGKELLEKLKDKVKDYWQKILDKLKDKTSYAGNDEARNLQERFEELVEEFEHDWFMNKRIPVGLHNKLTEIFKKMRDRSIDMSDRSRAILEYMKRKAPDSLKGIFDHFDIIFSDDVGKDLNKRIEELLGKIKDAWDDRKTIGTNVLTKLKDVYQEMKEKSIPLGEKAKEIIEQLKEKAGSLWKRIMDKFESPEDFEIMFGGKAKDKNSLSDVLEEFKNLFKDLGLELKEKFTKFGKWVKEEYSKGLNKGKNKFENVKRIAKEFLKDTKQISKDVAEEALDFFHEFKKDLGSLFDDIETKVKDVIKKDL